MTFGRLCVEQFLGKFCSGVAFSGFKQILKALKFIHDDQIWFKRLDAALGQQFAQAADKEVALLAQFLWQPRSVSAKPTIYSLIDSVFPVRPIKDSCKVALD